MHELSSLYLLIPFGTIRWISCTVISLCLSHPCLTPLPYFSFACWTSLYLSALSGNPLSPETGSLHSRSGVVKTSFGHIPSIEQSKREVFITLHKIFFQFSMGLLRNLKLCTASIVYLLYSMVKKQELVILPRVFLLLI